jgi:hypothetical protein
VEQSIRARHGDEPYGCGARIDAATKAIETSGREMSVVLSDCQLAAEIGNVLRQICLRRNDFRWRKTAVARHAVIGDGTARPSPRKGESHLGIGV